MKEDQTEDELMRISPVSYCLMQCNKICYFCKLLWKWEIIRMHVEFHTDYNGNIWLFFANQIWIRETNDWAKNHDEMFSQFILKEMRKEQ